VTAAAVARAADQGKVTIREGNGRIDEFQASNETLGPEEGDRLEARLRSH